MKLTKPTLLIDKQKCLQNIKRMSDKAAKNGLLFRPHFKTHQSVEVGEWFKEFGVTAIAVSSVDMAEKFAAAGWSDITIALSLNIHELPRINQLAKNCKINILLENIEVFPFIRESVFLNIGFFIKIDAGYHRTGIDASNTELIDAILSAGSKNSRLSFKGFIIHSGNTYQADSTEEIQQIHNSTLQQAAELKARYQKQFPNLILSIGDTPSCSQSKNFSSVDEMRPGNFVYFDVMQYYLGSCKLHDIAVCVACPVLAIHKNRNEIVVHGGAVHLSKEFIGVDGHRVFGLAVKLQQNSWQFLAKGNYVKSLSQEHGIIKMDDSEISSVKIGDFIGILPTHSCLSANLLKECQLIV